MPPPWPEMPNMHPLRHLAGVATAFGLLTCPSVALASDGFRYVCQDAGAGGYESFPDVCRMRDGRLLCVFYAGYDHVSLPKPGFAKGGRVAGAFSSDEGRTWTAARTLIDTPEDDRDPSVTQLADGRLAMTFFTYAGQGKFGTAIAYSSDAGTTWTSPESTAPGYAVSSPIREIRGGRWVLGVYWEDEAAKQGLGAVLISDDHGKSWTPPVKIDNAGLRLDAETDIVELRDGRLWAAQRGASGVQLHGSFSTDRGQTWSPSKPAGFEGHCPYLLRTAEGAVLLAVREFDNGPIKGATTLRISRDECQTWSAPVVVDRRGGSYPSMVPLKDGSVLIVWYEDKAAKADIRSRTFDPKTLKLH